jgi:pyruvate formate lyase activating enzyme
MKIAGLVKSSLIDYPGKVAAVVFTQGCNFHCGFCHNPDLISVDGQQSLISSDEIFSFLNTRKGKLDGVVITGGEPLIQPDIIKFIKNIKDLGFLVKLDTNGSSPIVLGKIIEQNLVDYIAMDVKNDLEEYEKICGFNDTNKILESISLIMSSDIDYEFRTTVLPYYHSMAGLNKLASTIEGAQKFTIQGFRPKIVYDKSLINAKSFTQKELKDVAEIFMDKVEQVIIHDNLA